MSTTAEALLDQLKKLPREEQQEVSLQLQRMLTLKPTPKTNEKFPTERLPGGPITSEQVAEVLDDE